MPETKEHQKQRHKHHQTLGGVTHGVYHGVAHGEHTVMHSRNMHTNRVKANPHAGGAHGWVYTTKKGDTLGGLQKRAWGTFGGINITSYANNTQLLKSQHILPKSRKAKDQYAYYTNPLRPGTRIVL